MGNKLNKKNIAEIIVLLVVISVFFILFSVSRNNFRQAALVEGPGERIITDEKLKTGVGYSTRKDSVKAANEAYISMKSQLGGKNPNFIILYSSVGYNQEEVLKEINLLSANRAKIYGCMSLIGVTTNSGFHYGEDVDEGNGLALMGFLSDEIDFGVGGSKIEGSTKPREAGRSAISQAISNAGKTAGEKPKIVFVCSSTFGMGVEEEVTVGIEDIIGKNIPVVGGVSSGKGDYSGGWKAFANEKVYDTGVVVAPIYTNLKIGYVFLAGFSPTDISGKVTGFEKTNERMIKTIDNKPAEEVLNNWLGGLLNNYIGTDTWFIDKTGLNPLGEKIYENDGSVNYRLIYAWHFNSDKSVTVGSDVATGTELHLLEGDADMLIKRPSYTARLAMNRGGIKKGEVAGVVMDMCAGTMRNIPIGKVFEISPLVNEAAGNAPFIGEYSSGEFGYFSQAGNKYGNMMVSMIVFGKN